MKNTYIFEYLNFTLKILNCYENVVILYENSYKISDNK